MDPCCCCIWFSFERADFKLYCDALSEPEPNAERDALAEPESDAERFAKY